MLDALARRAFLPVNAKVKVVRPREAGGRRPSVSVVIPCYSYGRYLPQCVNSALDQEGVDVDVLVIDDASPDGSAEAARQLTAADPRVRAICHAENRGHIATYNEGLAQATGDYVVLLSADDLLAPGCLARATSLMEEYPSVGLAYGFPVDFTGSSLPPARMTARSWIIWPGHDWLAHRCKLGQNIIRSPEVVLRTSVLRAIGGYRADLPHAADFELWMRTATVSDIGYVAGADQAYYRYHASNMHRSTFDMVDDLAQRLASFDAVFSECSHRLADPISLQDTAHRALARRALNQAMRDIAHRALARNTVSQKVRELSESAVGGEETHDYTAFALKAWPDARKLPEWRALERADRGDGAPRLSAPLMARMATRKLGTRARLVSKRMAGV
jgi:glycosyltransferase involved in cell wall biosynthesis